VLALLSGILDPQTLIEKGGLLLVAGIIFAESGLLIGFFLPGDSLLFITGFLATKPEGLPHVDYPLPVVLVVLFFAAVAGDQVGYLFGKKAGPALFNRPNSKLFKRENVLKGQKFFDTYGPKAILLARFVPIARTFVPIIAGVSNMKYKTFVLFNIVGGLVWAVGVTTLGYFLGQVSWVKNNIELASLAVVTISILPIIFEVIKHRRARTAH
jgi:membrane-associated protein